MSDPVISMQTESFLSLAAVDREFEIFGQAIESCVPGSGQLRFIEVKGRVSCADVIPVMRNDI